jgi:hypothetical protein
LVNLATSVTGTLPLGNGGTGQITAQAAMNSFAGAVTSGQYLRGNGTNVVMSAIQAADVPTLNQSTTGTAANVTGIVAFANGGTGQTSRQAAMDALAGAVTAGQYLRGDGTDVVMSAIQAADVPTLNQNTTGSAATFTSTTQNSQFNSIGVGTAASATAGEIRATNNITAFFSDDRLKTKLGKIEGALDKLCSLEGFYYEPNEVAQSLGYAVIREVGISAQQMKEVLPEIVVPAPVDEKYMTVRYERALPLVIEAIKELRAEIEALKQ